MFCIPKILKNESNSQHLSPSRQKEISCFVSQRYWKMKAIHNPISLSLCTWTVVLYPKDTEKWKQFTTSGEVYSKISRLFCIPKILKNESNSQQASYIAVSFACCFVSQRYWKMKAIHNRNWTTTRPYTVVLYPKDTEKWKQFTTTWRTWEFQKMLFCIPKILKNESNSQLFGPSVLVKQSCFVSQRYWKMKSSKGKARRFGVAKAIQNLRAVGKEITKAFEEGLKDDFLKSFNET